MSDDFEIFERDLRSQLVRAAAAQEDVATPVETARRRPLVLAAACVLLVGIIGGLLVATQSREAAAEVFEITRRDGEIVLSVIDVVDDPQSVVDQLSREAELEAEVFAVPVPDDLIGAIIAIGSLGSLEPEFDATTDGTITQIRVPEQGGGPLVIEYGRPAEDGEFYRATSSDPACARLFGKDLADAVEELDRLASSTQFQLNLPDGSARTEVPLDEIPEDARIIEVSFLGPNHLFVEVVTGELPEPRHPNCRPEQTE